MENRPSFLRNRDADLVALAEFSSDTFRDPSRRWAPEPRPRLFLCGSPNDAPPAGRMVVLSGEGVFINSMIAGVFVLFWNFARKGAKWAFYAGMSLYLLDGLILLAVGGGSLPGGAGRPTFGSRAVSAHRVYASRPAPSSSCASSRRSF